MEVQTLKPHQYNQWNTFVDQSPQGDIFCYSWWLTSITKSNFKILAIYENDEIVAGIPLALDNRGKVNIPPLTRTLGVLYKMQDYQSARKKISAERKWLYELLKHIISDDFVQMCMHHNFTDWLPFRWNGFSQTTRYTYILNYEKKTSGELWNNLDLRNRKIIKKSNKNGIRVETTDDFDLIYHYESLSYERQDLKFEIPYNDLKFLDDAIKERGYRIIFKATDNSNQVHAVLYVAFNKKSAYALLSGSDPNLRKQGGHTLILWEAVMYFSGRVDCFNFGGSDIEKIESHLKGFGGTLTPYFQIYNEKLIWKRNDFRYHLHEISFHLREVFKILKNKILKSFRNIK
jgi:hypothetical protein